MKRARRYIAQRELSDHLSLSLLCASCGDRGQKRTIGVCWRWPHKEGRGRE